MISHVLHSYLNLFGMLHCFCSELEPVKYSAITLKPLTDGVNDMAAVQCSCGKFRVLVFMWLFFVPCCSGRFAFGVVWASVDPLPCDIPQLLQSRFLGVTGCIPVVGGQCHAGPTEGVLDRLCLGRWFVSSRWGFPSKILEFSKMVDVDVLMLCVFSVCTSI